MSDYEMLMIMLTVGLLVMAALSLRNKKNRLTTGKEGGFTANPNRVGMTAASLSAVLLRPLYQSAHLFSIIK